MDSDSAPELLQIGLMSGKTFIIRGQLTAVRDAIASSKERLEQFELQSPDGEMIYIAPASVAWVRRHT